MCLLEQNVPEGALGYPFDLNNLEALDYFEGFEDADDF